MRISPREGVALGAAVFFVGLGVFLLKQGFGWHSLRLEGMGAFCAILGVGYGAKEIALMRRQRAVGGPISAPAQPVWMLRLGASGLFGMLTAVLVLHGAWPLAIIPLAGWGYVLFRSRASH